MVGRGGREGEERFAGILEKGFATMEKENHLLVYSNNGRIWLAS